MKEADGANTGATALPTPDAIGTLTMSASAGRIAVVDAAGAIVDLVGYGSTAAQFEGSGPAPGTTNSTSVSRIDACVDTDHNAADFAAGAPSPSTPPPHPRPAPSLHRRRTRRRPSLRSRARPTAHPWPALRSTE